MRTGQNDKTTEDFCYYQLPLNRYLWTKMSFLSYNTKYLWNYVSGKHLQHVFVISSLSSYILIYQENLPKSLSSSSKTYLTATTSEICHVK